MPSSLTDLLCTRCGLCCSGTLFADVELAGPAEATRLAALGLEIDDEGAGAHLLAQPCAALRGTRCSIYSQRPKCCRTFECHLLRDVRDGRVTEAQAFRRIARALDQVGQVEALLVQVGDQNPDLPLNERCAERLAREPRPDLAERRALARLETALTKLERTIRKTFLGRERKPGTADRV